MLNYKGIMTALVTPLDSNGSVDEKSLRKLIQFQIKNNVSSILILGGTGEYCALTNKGRKQAIEIAVNEVSGQIPVVAGIITPGLGDAIELSGIAKQAAADAIMVVTPYYLSPTQEGMIDYFQQLDRDVNMPLFLYNIPYKTGVNMKPETVEALVGKIPNIVGIKECSTDLSQFIDLMRRVGDKISVLSGEEFLAVSEFVLGAHGAVMATANLVPNVWVQIWEMVQSGDIQKAVDLSYEYYPLFKTVFKEGNPGPLKAAMNMIGLPAGKVSSPLVTPSNSTLNELKDEMEKLLKNKYDEVREIWNI